MNCQLVYIAKQLLGSIALMSLKGRTLFWFVSCESATHTFRWRDERDEPFKRVGM